MPDAPGERVGPTVGIMCCSVFLFIPIAIFSEIDLRREERRRRAEFEREWARWERGERKYPPIPLTYQRR